MSDLSQSEQTTQPTRDTTVRFEVIGGPEGACLAVMAKYGGLNAAASIGIARKAVAAYLAAQSPAADRAEFERLAVGLIEATEDRNTVLRAADEIELLRNLGRPPADDATLPPLVAGITSKDKPSNGPDRAAREQLVDTPTDEPLAPGFWPGEAPGGIPGVTDREETGPIGAGTPHARMRWFWDRMERHKDLIAELTGWSPISSTYRFEAAIADAFDKLAAERLAPTAEPTDEQIEKMARAIAEDDERESWDGLWENQAEQDVAGQEHAEMNRDDYRCNARAAFAALATPQPKGDER